MITCGRNQNKQVAILGKGDFFKDVYSDSPGTPFHDSRKKLENNEFPFDDGCISCEVAHCGDSYVTGDSWKKINTITVEPTVLCNIECPNCEMIDRRHLSRVETENGKTMLNLELLHDLLESLSKGGVQLILLSIKGGGNRLLIKKFGSLPELQKTYFRRQSCS